MNEDADGTPVLEDLPAVLWRVGDPWRDLRPELDGSSETLVAVTSHGSVRAVSLEQNRQIRLPAEGHSRIDGDYRWMPLEGVPVLTPCGVVTWGYTASSWSASTSLVVAFFGPIEAAGRVVAAFGGGSSDLSDHPVEPCGAPYCPRGDRMTWTPPV